MTAAETAMTTGRGRAFRCGRAVALPLALAVLLSAPIAALANDVCQLLRAQLDQPSRIIGNSAEVRRFANALTQQNIVIRRIKNDLRGYGCTSGSIVVYGSPNASLCAEIDDALSQAIAERDMIAEDRDRMLAMQRNSQREDNRARILAALDAEGCDDHTRDTPGFSDPYAEPALRGNDEPFSAPDASPYQSAPDAAVTGGLRTLCVRTCDGAFFPISSNATPLDFEAQAAQCERMCPGTETELFYHAMEGQESADMVSAKTGEPYTRLPNAFAYRNGSPAGRKPSCSCTRAVPQTNPDTPGSAGQSRPDPSGQSLAHLPKDTPPPAAAAPPQAPVPERDYDPKNSHVRVVGPQFLPEEAGRIDLKNPALKGVQPQQQ